MGYENYSLKVAGGVILFIIGPLIRITGLAVAAVAVQMILNGIGEWFHVIAGK